MFSLKHPNAIAVLIVTFALCGCDLGTPDDPGRDNPLDAHNPNPPLAPSNLTITQYSWNSIRLDWIDRSGNEDGFRLERKTGNEGNWELLYQTATNITAYNNSGLSPTTTYFYRVNAFNEAGASAYSDVISHTTPLAPPAAPTNLRFVSATFTQITLRWDDNSTNEDGFRIERKLAPTGEWSQIYQTGVGVTTFTHSGLTPGAVRYYRVRAFNRTDNSPYSNEMFASTIGPPSAPSNLVATAISPTQISLRWVDNSLDEDSFKVERRITPTSQWSQIFKAGPGVTTFTHSGITPMTTRYYRVCASNGGGNSEYSNEAFATTQGAPEAPSGLRMTSSTFTDITLQWNDNSTNEQGFVLERKFDQVGQWSVLFTSAAGVTNYTHSGMEPATTRYYRVKAFNVAGDSPYSNELIASTQGPPIAPSNLTASAISSTQIRLNWRDNSSNEEGFKVERKQEVGSAWAEIARTGAEVATFTHSGLVPNSTRYYRVRAFNIAGDSQYSNEANATTPPAPPEAPSELEVIGIGSTLINLKWRDNSGQEDGFRLERKTGQEGDWSIIRELTANTSSFANLNLTPLTTYYYRVHAFNVTGESANSNEVFATTNPILERDFPLGNSGESVTMVWIEAGSFQMGSPDYEQDRSADEGPVHAVRFARGFWMGKYEVTQRQWRAVTGGNPNLRHGVGDNFPVYSINWEDIQVFEAQLGDSFRLPSEAEWEYACRSNLQTRFHWGDDLDEGEADAYSWFNDNSSSTTHPVGQKTANGWGLYDMSGNALEWVEDSHHEDYTGAPDDGSAWILGGDGRVLRGGSWSNPAENGRSANRLWLQSDNQHYLAGFRLVLSQ